MNTSINMYNCLFCGAKNSIEKTIGTFSFEYNGRVKCFDNYILYRCTECNNDFEEPGDNLEI